MVLLTGASGFIGKHLLTSLINDFGRDNVLALTSVPLKECPYVLHSDYTFSPDLFVKNGYGESIDTIIHAGAFIPKNAAQGNDWKLCNKNISNTQCLLEAKLPALKRFIYLSTVDVYGRADIISENTRVDPVSLYGHSKLYVERVINEWAKSESKICQVLRVGHVYGPGEEAYQKLIPATMKKIARGDKVEIWGDGKELRAFIYIDDVVRAIIRSLNIDSSVGPINMVSNNSVSVTALVDKIIAIAGKKVNVQTIPSTVEGRNLIFDNNKMKQCLGTEETSLESGLTKEWQYMQSLAL